MVTGIDQYGTRYVSMHSPELSLVNWATWPLYPDLYPYTATFMKMFGTYFY